MAECDERDRGDGIGGSAATFGSVLYEHIRKDKENPVFPQDASFWADRDIVADKKVERNKFKQAGPGADTSALRASFKIFCVWRC